MAKAKRKALGKPDGDENYHSPMTAQVENLLRWLKTHGADVPEPSKPVQRAAHVLTTMKSKQKWPMELGTMETRALVAAGVMAHQLENVSYPTFTPAGAVAALLAQKLVETQRVADRAIYEAERLRQQNEDLMTENIRLRRKGAA